MDFGDFGGGGGGMDLSSIFGRISQLAPNWDPFPILQQMNQTPMAPTMSDSPQGGGFAGFMDPRSGVDPSKMTSGPLAGLPATGSQGLPTPPAAMAGAAPLTIQQMAALKAMQPPVQAPHFTPGVAPANLTHAVQMTPIGTPAGTPLRPSLAQILGR